MQIIGKIVWQILKQLNIVTACPSSSTPMCSREMKKYISIQNLYTTVYANVMAALVITAKKWKQPKCRSTEEQNVIQPHNGIILNH